MSNTNTLVCSGRRTTVQSNGTHYPLHEWLTVIAAINERGF
ncbi:hypothetical protein [Nostoc sp.]